MFEVPGGEILILSVQHFGSDAWKPDYFRQLLESLFIPSFYDLIAFFVRFFFDDGKRVICPIDEFINEEESIDILSCELQNNNIVN